MLSVALLVGFVNPGAHAQQITPVSAAAALFLPPFCNTPEADRLMLREIGDQHVFAASAQLAVSTSERTIARTAEDLLVLLEEPDGPAPSVWQSVRQSRRLVIPENPAIEAYRQQYRDEAIWISRILARATPFIGHIVESLDARYLPVELALLPAIESGYQPDIHSTENAAGIWQIVPVTARSIGLKHTRWFDGRADIVKSTVAAIDYLSYLNAEFHGDWLLTLAAYNAGPGRVRNAIQSNQAKGLPVDFFSLPLPRETRNYVPKFLALVDMLRSDSVPDLKIPVIEHGDGFEIIDIGQRTSVDRVALVSGIPESTLKTLNAALVHGVTPPAGPHQLYVPRQMSTEVLTVLSRLEPDELYTLPATYTVVAGDTISSIAHRYGLSQARLMELNALDDTLIRVGQALTMRHVSADHTGNMEYVVTIGDTLSDIARRFSVDIDRIQGAEGRLLNTDIIHPGERLIILLDPGIAG